MGQQILVADRSERAKLRFTGEQRGWFLHQILTQAFEDIEPGEVRDAALLTAHGRMVGYLEALATQDSILCHFETELGDTLPDAIRRYVFATRVEVTDVTDEIGLVLIVGDGWRDFADRVLPVPRLQETTSLGVPAGYVWVDRVYVSDALLALEKGGARPATEEELEDIRIAHGVARWGREMDTKTFPQEVAVDERAVHYDKGCYVGQEAMAKIHFRGKVNRALRMIEAADSLSVGADLSVDEKKVGRVTSASDGRGLALVRREIEPGVELRAGDLPVKVVG